MIILKLSGAKPQSINQILYYSHSPYLLHDQNQVSFFSVPLFPIIWGCIIILRNISVVPDLQIPNIWKYGRHWIPIPFCIQHGFL